MGDWIGFIHARRLASAPWGGQICEMTIVFGPGVREAMLAAAARAGRHEACGLLLGHGTCVETAVATANVAQDPARHFEIDPAALIGAHRLARSGAGPQVLGYFHSHPNGIAAPSATDAASAAHDGRVWAIVAGDAITCWHDGSDGFEPLSYRVCQG